MNAGVTVGLGKKVALVLIGPNVPIRDQMRRVKRKEVEVPPGVDRVEIWSRTGLLKRRKLKSGGAPAVQPAPAAKAKVQDDDEDFDASPEGDGESPVAEAKRGRRKKE